MTDDLDRIFRLVWNRFNPKNQKDIQSARTACIVRLCMTTLQPLADIISLRVPDIDLERGVWRVDRAARCAGHLLPLLEITTSLIRHALELRANEKGDHLFLGRDQMPGLSSLRRDYDERMTLFPHQARLKLDELPSLGKEILVRRAVSSSHSLLQVAILLNWMRDGYHPNNDRTEMRCKRRVFRDWEKQIRELARCIPRGRETVRSPIMANDRERGEASINAKESEVPLSTVHVNMMLGSIWNAFDPETECDTASTRNALIVRLCMTTLQRPARVMGMKTSSLDFRNGVWRVNDDDGYHVHELPITPLTAALIKSALALRADLEDPYVFQDGREKNGFDLSVQRAFKKRLRSRDHESVSLHDLRHAGRMLLRSRLLSVPNPSVCRVLGHYSLVRSQELPYLRGYYQRTEMDDKRQVLKLWESHLRRTVENLASSASPSMISAAADKQPWKLGRPQRLDAQKRQRRDPPPPP